MIKFSTFYSQFLSCERGNQVVSSPLRSQTFSFYWKIPCIITDYWNNLSASVSSEFLDKFKMGFALSNFQRIDKQLLTALDNWFSSYSWQYMINIYQRCSLNRSSEKLEYLANAARPLNANDYEITMSYLNHRSEGFKKAVWKNYYLPLVKNKRIFIVEEDKRKVSEAIITDINNGGANIMVKTDADFRQCGFGKAVVAKAAIHCLENGLLSCYFYQTDNTPSAKLAESLNFEYNCQECNIFQHT